MKPKKKNVIHGESGRNNRFSVSAPSFIGFLVFILIPVVWGLLLSFFDYNGFKHRNL